MAKLVDALDLGSSGETCESSSLSSRTNFYFDMGKNMQVTVEKLSNVERQMTVLIPSESINQSAETRLNEVAKTAKIDGFRAGKVPKDVLRKRFYPAILGEVTEKTINTNLQEALKQENLSPIGQMTIVSLSEFKGNEPLTCIVKFEIYPEIPDINLSQIEIERTVAEVAEQDVDEMLEIVRNQFATWHETKEAAQKSDRVLIDSVATVDGKPFPEGTEKDHEVLLGSEHYYADFAKPLYGATVGAELDYPVAYPADYSEKDLANKNVQFHVTVKKVLRPELPPVDDKLAEKLGVKEGGVEKLRADIRKNIQREVDTSLRRKFYDVLVKQLVEKNPIDLPNVFLDAEKQRVLKRMEERNKEYSKYFGGKDAKFELPKLSDAEVDKAARYNVASSLLLGKLVEQYDIKAEDKDVQQKIAELASSYEDPSKAIAWYNKTPEEQRHIRAEVLEEKTMQVVLTHIVVKEKKVSYKEAVRLGRANQ